MESARMRRLTQMISDFSTVAGLNEPGLRQAADEIFLRGVSL